jgi:hypothetical protein
MYCLYCNSIIMGQTRWWLKLVFSFLDVGTANALTVFHLAMKESVQLCEMSLFDFKFKMVYAFVGIKIKDIINPITIVPELIKQESPNFCAYFVLFNLRKGQDIYELRKEIVKSMMQ